MRILLTADPIIPVPPVGYGGIERIVDSLVREYGRLGHAVALHAHPASTSPATVRFGWPGRNVSAWSDTLRNTLALRRSVAAFRPDVVHSFSRLAYLASVLPRAVPKVMSYQRHTGGRQIAWAARLAGRSLHFTGCSEFIAHMGRRAGGTWSAIPNFVEPAAIQFSATVAPDAPLVFLSRVERIKGPHVAIQIARRAGRRLIIAGNQGATAADREFWQSEIAPQIDRDGIEYAGEVDDRRKNDLLSRAAALLVPIQWDEPFGIVFAEALAAGTPVITCARGALPEIVDPGRTGFFVDSVESGVTAVARLPELDRAECRRVAEQIFSVTACARQYLRCYDEVISASGAKENCRP